MGKRIIRCILCEQLRKEESDEKEICLECKQWLEKRRAKVKKAKFYNYIDNIIDYESGVLADNDILVLFSELIKNGMVYHLQGCYGRTAEALIEAGYLNIKGDILKEFEA